jgi:hypothetical protein
VQAAGAEVARKLSFIEEVMGRTRERDERGNFIPIWCAAVTVGALAAMWSLALATGRCTAGQAAVIWVSHNALLWGGTLLAVRRSGQVSTVGRQIMGTWAVATAAFWAIPALATWTGAIATWAEAPLGQLVMGLALAFSGILLRHPAGIVGGLTLVATVPLVAALGARAQPFVFSAVLIAGAVLMLVICDVIRWRRNRAARAA